MQLELRNNDSVKRPRSWNSNNNSATPGGENVHLAQTITRLEGELQTQRDGTGDEATAEALSHETEELRENLGDTEERLDKEC